MTHHDTTESEVRAWLRGRLPADLFVGDPEVVVDREEITVVGPIAEPERREGESDADHAATIDGAIAEFRERTREQRIRVARELERRSGRKVAWGVTCGERRALYTHLAVPVTRWWSPASRARVRTPSRGA